MNLLTRRSELRLNLPVELSVALQPCGANVVTGRTAPSEVLDNTEKL